MRVTKIAGDFHDIGDRPCRVYCNEVEIEGWTVADDFRRVVETPGKVHHGAVRIDLAPEVPELAPEPPIVYGTVRTPDGQEVGSTMQHFDVAQPICDAAVRPESVERIWADKSQICATPVKPKHIPARKRKAGK